MDWDGTCYNDEQHETFLEVLEEFLQYPIHRFYQPAVQILFDQLIFIIDKSSYERSLEFVRDVDSIKAKVE